MIFARMKAIMLRGQTVEVGDRVQVRVRSGNAERWKLGKVREHAKNGCFVQFEDGTANFFFANQVRAYDEALEPEATTTPVSRAHRALTASLGEVAGIPRLREQPPQRLVRVERRAPEASGPVASPAPPQSDEPPTHVRAVEPANEPKTRVMKKKHVHTQTEIGNRFRSVRIQRVMKQVELGQKLGISSNAVSSIELGDRPPTDDELLRFAECFGDDLEILIALRDGKPDDEDPPPAAPSPPAPVPEPPPPAPPPAAVMNDFVAYFNRISDAAPPPQDAAKRAEWFGHVHALFELAR